MSARKSSPHLVVPDVARAVRFYESAFEGQLLYQTILADGTITDAHVQVGEVVVMLTSEDKRNAAHSLRSRLAPENEDDGVVALLVSDVDGTCERAYQAGARILERTPMPRLLDPFGHVWALGTGTAASPRPVRRARTRTVETLPRPEAKRRVSPHLKVEQVEKAIDFYRFVFNATVLYQASLPDGTLTHAQVQVGDIVVFLTLQLAHNASHEMRSSPSPDPDLAAVDLRVADADAVFERAMEKGAQPSILPRLLEEGGRQARFRDPFGGMWSVTSHPAALAPPPAEPLGA